MKENSEFDSINSLLNSNRDVKSKTFDTLLPKQNEQYTSESPFADKDPDETISESEEEDSNQEESQVHWGSDSEKQKNNKEKMEQGRWTTSEHLLFLEGLIKYGNEWKMVQKHIKSRSSTQARSHAQKFFIRIKKNIANERNPDNIKKKIHQIFKEEMQDDFRPDNLSLFLDKIMKLVFVSELGKKNSHFKEDKNQSNNNDNSLSFSSSPTPTPAPSSYNEHETHSHKHLAKKLASDPIDFLDLNEKKRNGKNRKESFFSIEKDIERINIKQSKTKMDRRPEANLNQNNNTNMGRNYYENSTQTIQNTRTPSCINIVNITMVNNSTNTYVQNYNNDQPKKKCSFGNDFNSNPFHLQFDELITQPTMNSNNNNNNNQYDNNMYYQDEEHLFANFDF